MAPAGEDPERRIESAGINVIIMEENDANLMSPGKVFVPVGSKVEQLKHGGEGSGNFGHAGRPGEVGGSGPGGGTPEKSEEKPSEGRRLIPGAGVPTTIERKQSIAKDYADKMAAKGKPEFGALVVDDNDQWLVEKFDKTIDLGTPEKPDYTNTKFDSVPGVIVGSIVRETDKAILISGRPLFDEENFRSMWKDVKYQDRVEEAIKKTQSALSLGTSRQKEWVPKSRIIGRYGLTPKTGAQ